MLTSFQIVKVGHASRLKKSSGFNSAQAVHEHRLKEAKSSQNLNVLRLNRRSHRQAAGLTKGFAGSWRLACQLTIVNKKFIEKASGQVCLLATMLTPQRFVLSCFPNLKKKRSLKTWRLGR